MKISFLNKEILENEIVEKENELLNSMIKGLQGKLHLFMTGMIKATTPEQHNYYHNKVVNFALDPKKTWDEYLEELEFLPEEWNFKIKVEGQE